MDAKPRAVDRVYEDFEPQTEWAREERFDTLIVLLPGQFLIPSSHVHSHYFLKSFPVLAEQGMKALPFGDDG